jgi:hypothetical protein
MLTWQDSQRSQAAPLVMDDSQAADFLLVDLRSKMEVLEASVTRINHYI